MTIPAQPNVKLTNAADYREAYANSVQMRVNVWDFFMVFGTLQQQTETQVEIRNFQGIYLSPQQAKALLGDRYPDFLEEVELVRGASPPFDLERYRAARQTPVFFGSAVNSVSLPARLPPSTYSSEK